MGSNPSGRTKYTKMKTLVKLFVLFCLCFSVAAHAYSSSNLSDALTDKFNKLSPQQQAEIYKTVVDKQAVVTAAAASEVAPTITPEKIKQYGDIGITIGDAIANTARQLGVVANDFVKTPVGIITIMLIVWSIAGSAVVHIVGGFLTGSVLLIIWWRTFKSQCLIQSVTEEQFTPDGNGKRLIKRKTKVNRTISGDTICGYWFILGIITFTTALITFTW